MSALEEAWTGAAWIEEEHPREPGGVKTGGQWIEKSGVKGTMLPEKPMVKGTMLPEKQLTKGEMVDRGSKPPASTRFAAGTKLYHASYVGDEIVKGGFQASRMGESGPGVYLTPTTNMFERYPERQHLEVVLDKDINVLDRTKPEGEKIYRQIQTDASIDKGDRDWGEVIGEKLRAAGYDGVYYDSSGDVELVIHDPSILKARLIATAWVEEEHPRDPGGEGGGQFVEKGTSPAGATVEPPRMGLGTPELEAELRKKNAVPPLVEEQMEADLKDFLVSSELNMRVPEEAMLEILDEGEFQNQHQAKNARGLGRTPEKEAALFGLPEGTPPEDLAKYGYLGPDHQGVNGYGPIKVVFKDSVKDRTAFTIGDSYMLGDSVIPSPVRDPSYLSANLGQIDEAAGSWATDQGVELDYGVGGMNMRYGAEPTDFTPDGDLWYSAIANERTSIPYAEAQIYGKLTPADIARVEVPLDEDWDLESGETGLPLVNNKEAMQQAIIKLEQMGITVSTYQVPGDYSGEWA